jgi:site-specific DNA-cytosine methylase
VQDAAQGHLMQWPPEIAPTINAHFGNKQGLENQHINGGGECLPLVSKCLITKNRMDAETETLIPTTGGHFNSDPVLQPAYGIPGNWIGRKPENGGNATEPMHDIAPCLTKADQHGVAQPIAFSKNDNGMDATHDLAPTMRAAGNSTGMLCIATAMAVRRLTPKECERLQGFPDNYTDIQAKGKPTPDGPRYKALGNSMAVPVMAWIGQRIEQVEAICKQNK